MVDMSIDSDSTEQSALFLRTIIWPRDFLYGPAIYFYVREMTLPGRYSLLPKQWLHFLPAILHAALFWMLAAVHAPMHKAMLTDDTSAVPDLAATIDSIVNVELFSSIVHIGIYLWLAVSVLKSHRQRIESTFSYNERISLAWLRRLLFGIIAVYLILVFTDLFGYFVSLPDNFGYLLGISLVALVNAALVQEMPDQEGADAHKYKTSSLSDDLSQQLIVELKALMSRDKPYLDSQLSLPQLAEQLSISVNYLSQIINEQLNQNFFEFVNSYRVDEAKTVLSDTNRKKENILTIALDSGFNSKSSFYTAFKKHTEMTPGEFRKRA